MFKISMVLMTTAMFAGLLVTGPVGGTATSGANVAYVKVKTIAIRPIKVAAQTASFERATIESPRKPSIRRTSGRLVAWN